MEYFSENYKKYLEEHYVLDAWQFVANTRKNVATADYCYHIIQTLISKMEEEHRRWQEGINNELSKQIAEKGKGSIGISYDNLPQSTIDMFGLPIDYSFLIDKYIKDFFQYVRNAMDSAAQIVNSALLANECLDIEKVDFNKIVNTLNKPAYSQIFSKTLAVLAEIQSSTEFAYISEFNNKIKHISDAKLIMSQELFGNVTTARIEAFYKRGNQFAEQDILTMTKIVLDFVEREVGLLLDVLTKDIKLNAHILGRVHELKFHVQRIKDNPDSSFTVVFVEVIDSMDELPEVLRVLLARSNEEVNSLNSDYGDILVRDKNTTFVGRFILDEVINEDGLLRYRRYKKDDCEGIIAFIEQSKKNYPIRPFLMTGEIVSVGFNESESTEE